MAKEKGGKKKREAGKKAAPARAGKKTKASLEAGGGKAPKPAGKGAVEELLDMDQAIKLLRTSRPTFYRWLREGKIKGRKLGRQWRFYREDIQRFLAGEEPRIELRADISPLMESLMAALAELDVKPEGLREDDVVRVVGLMIWVAQARGASDIHIEPHMSTEAVARVRIRVDGVMHLVAEFDIRLLAAVVERWKIMANVDVHEKARPQDGRIVVEIRGESLDLRVNFMPGAIGEAVTARILSRDQVALDLDRIDYVQRDRDLLDRCLQDPLGTIVVTGPTGCGKTTVLYSCLARVAGEHVKTVSIEDPVEYFMPWTHQAHLNHAAGIEFPYMMRAALRSDPDVILVGEIRNFETLQMIHQAALTGHLILTTLHAEEAAGALVRMVEMGSDPFVVADSTKLIISQRLVRKLCTECSREAMPRQDLLDLAADFARRGGLGWSGAGRGFREAVGCPKCGGLGYRGRTVIAEALEATPEIGVALRRGAGIDELRSIAVGQGMTTMAADGVRRAAAGETSIEEVIRVLGLR